MRTRKTRDSKVIRRGRPSLPVGAAKRASFNTRLRQQTKEGLEAEAAKAGRSLSEEIEWRLEASLERQNARAQFFGGPELDALFKHIAGAVEFIEQKTGGKWTKDYETYIAVTAALDHIVKEVRSMMRPTPTARTVAMVTEVIEMEPKRPDVRRPTPAELLGQPAEQPGYIVGLMGGAIPPAEPGFASVEDAKRSEKEWAEHDRQMEGYLQKLQDTKAYFDALTEIGTEAATQQHPKQTPREG